MTHIAIQEQIKEQIAALKKATAGAIKSKEAAQKYLSDAGIIPQKKEGKFGGNKSKK